METNFLTWHLLVPFILSLAIFAARWLRRNTRPVVEILHLLSVTLVLVLSLFSVRDVLTNGLVISPGGWLHVDALSAIFLLIIGVVGFLAGVYSIGYTRHDLETGEFDTNRLSDYYGLFNLFLFTMLLVVTANNIIMMWVAVEATTLGSTFLVGIYRHHSSLEAAWKYVIICTVGVAFGLYGTILVYSDAVNVMQQPSTAVMWTEIIKNAGQLDPTLLKMAFIFVLIGFGTKAGLFPMHAWLPDAHSEAPSPVSALLSAVLLNCALLVIFRFTVITNLAIGPAFTQTLLIAFGMLSVAAAAFFMFMQRDIKRLLAYSSMENIGLVVLAFGLGGPAGIFAGLLHALNHSLVKALMFCTSGNILIKYRSRNLDQVKGMLQAIPVSGVFLILGALALVGTPPFNIFVSKFYIIATGLGSGYFWLMIVCLLLLTVVFASFFKVIAAAVFGAKPENIIPGEFNWLTLAPAVVLIALMLMLGLYIPPQLSSLLQGATNVVLTGETAQLSTSVWQGLPVLANLRAFLLPLSNLLH
jgi:hydrogenase-4 component F